MRRSARSRYLVASRPLHFESLETRWLLHGHDLAGGQLAAANSTAQPVPDFQLTDVNPSSPRHGEQVSPRDYLEQTSAWYFAHST